MINEYGHTISSSECMDCHMIWVEIHEVACEYMKCPYCGSADTIRVLPQIPPPLCTKDL